MPPSPSGREGGLEDQEVMGIAKDLIGEEREVRPHPDEKGRHSVPLLECRRS